MNDEKNIYFIKFKIMAMTIKDLQPREVWKHFEALTQVPRPSGHLEKIQKYLLDFGKSINVETWQDEAGNIIMRKPATPGLEGRKGIILQAHMDMVPQKTPDSKHDFINDPITTIVKGDWLYADDTTLGADNGLGVAAIMAIMEDESLQHGPLEALITADEETGMYGAFGLKGGELEGELLLNLDSEEEGVLYIGCAGGLDITATMEFMEEASDEEDVAVKVQLKGLRGGHSGLEINAGRGNANKLMARFEDEAEFIKLPAPELVGFVERGQADSEDCREYLEKLLEPYADHKVDAVVLGCTHFPFARKPIQEILGEEVLVFEGSMGAAKQCQRLLAERDLLMDSETEGMISFENSDESKIEQCIKMFGCNECEG